MNDYISEYCPIDVKNIKVVKKQHDIPSQNKYTRLDGLKTE